MRGPWMNCSFHGWEIQEFLLSLAHPDNRRLKYKSPGQIVGELGRHDVRKLEVEQGANAHCLTVDKHVRRPQIVAKDPERPGVVDDTVRRD